jgi:hypothetical protein
MYNHSSRLCCVQGGEPGKDEDDEDENMMAEEVDNSLHMKGQMMFMAEWNVIMFLASPKLADLKALSFSGLFINDLPMHDFSRDLLLASEDLKRLFKVTNYCLLLATFCLIFFMRRSVLFTQAWRNNLLQGY